MKEQVDRLRGTVTGKVLFIGFLVLVLLLPMQMIQGLIAERSSLMHAARSEVGNSWGAAQTIGGPMLIVPFRYSQVVQGRTATINDALFVLPESLSIEGSVDPRILRRGIYEVPVYTATLSIGGELPAPSFDASYPELEILWGDARIVLPLTDARSITEPVLLRVGGAEATFEAGGNTDCFRGNIALVPTPPCRPSAHGDRLVVPFTALGLERLTEPQAFSLDLTVGGTGRLHFLPLGDVTRVSLRSPWPSPSFNGAFLPNTRDTAEQGFTASWRVLGLGRGYPAVWRRSEGFEQNLSDSSFGVDLILPIGVHEASLRAAKYAVLFLALTFLVYFLFEIFAALRLHALQYLTVGMANCVFFLLLLALAEHVGFGRAYAVSASASTILIGGYSAAILGAGRRAWPVAGVLAAVYSYLYVTLRAEDYALLFGAVGLFAVLAAFMILTRHVDWYAVTFDRR